MTDKELRRLRRDDLLQILIDQQRQNDELKAALDEARLALEDKRIKMNESGSIAEAAMRLNGVFEAAQAAVDQYTSQMREEADAMRDKARLTAEDVVQSARGEAERILREARAEAQRLKAEAAGRPAIEPQVEQQPAQPEVEKHRKGLLWRNRKA